MPQWFLKPENALKRADELLEVGKTQDALDALHDVMKSRRHKQWTKVHEDIMKRHLELCVELRKPHTAKDALWQYRNMVQQINSKSLEDVVDLYLDMAEKKATEAHEKSKGLVEAELIDDLDQAANPESLLLSAVSGADTQDRTDRAVLSPWLRFLWESYRQCLELLRNNAQVEHLYHKIARQAFGFCKKYQRRAEFRKLCDNLRQHYNQLLKSQHLSYIIKLNTPESLTALQETRLYQLDVAIQMELWQEAFKSSEDVHGMVQLSRDKDTRKVLKHQTAANYYEKLALVFWKAGNKLYHAAALLRLFAHYKEWKKSFSTEEASVQATRVLLATLSIPAGAGSPSDLARLLDIDEFSVENQRRLASLLDLKSSPTRHSLLKDIARFNITGLAKGPALELYRWLEQEFAPLKLSSEVETQLNNVSNLENPEFTQYVDALRQVASLKILKQVSEVYETITHQRLRTILPLYSQDALERLLVEAGKRGHVHIRVDHRDKSVVFLSAEDQRARGGLEQTDEDLKDTSAVSGEVGAVQSWPTEQLRGQLQEFYTVLRDTVDVLNAEPNKQIIKKQIRHHVTVYDYHKKDDYERMLLRRRRIEEFKEQSEKTREKQVIIEQQEITKKEEERRVTEQRRLEQESKDYEQMKRAQQTEDLKKQMLQDKFDNLMKSKIGQMVIEGLGQEKIETMDLTTEELIQEQVKQMEKERKEQQTKLTYQEKKWDHYVRALHEEEIPMRQKQYEEWKPRDREDWEAYQTEKIEAAKNDHQNKVETYERFTRMAEDTRSFMAKVQESRAGDLQKRIEDWQAKVTREREKRLSKRKEERRQKRREEWERAQEEEKKRKEMEEQQKKDEEERKNRQALRQANDPRGNRPQRDDAPEEGRSDEVDDWRRGAKPIDRPGPRAPGRDQQIGGPPVRAPQPGERSGEVDDWRSAKTAAPPRDMDRERPMMGASRGGEGVPPPQERAELESDWRKNRVPAPVRPPPQGEGPPVEDHPTPQETGPWRRGMAAPRREMVPPPMERGYPDGAGGYPPQDKRMERRPPPTESDDRPWRSGERPPPAGGARGPPPPSDEVPNVWRRGERATVPPPIERGGYQGEDRGRYQAPQREEYERDEYYERRRPPPPAHGGGYPPEGGYDYDREGQRGYEGEPEIQDEGAEGWTTVPGQQKRPPPTQGAYRPPRGGTRRMGPEGGLRDDRGPPPVAQGGDRWAAMKEPAQDRFGGMRDRPAPYGGRDSGGRDEMGAPQRGNRPPPQRGGASEADAKDNWRR